MTITFPSHLDDVELEETLGRLASGEREATAALVVHLAEFDARRLYEGAGFSSLFKYCVAVLRLSEDATYNRIEAARAARRYPVLVDMLASGQLSLTTVKLVARHLTPENHEELLAAAAGKGKHLVEELLACRFPQADLMPSVRKVATRDVPVSPATGSPTAPHIAHVVTATESRPLVRPRAPERYEIRFTASGEFREKLRRAQDLLGHAMPSGDLAQVFDRAVTLLVADLERRKFAATARPRPVASTSTHSRTVPAGVRRAVAARDGGRCAFVAMSGRRCDERRFVEFHHVFPHAEGGTATIENIQLRCRAQTMGTRSTGSMGRAGGIAGEMERSVLLPERVRAGARRLRRAEGGRAGG
jgi:hypothetical protein